jgi:hypothetical protein
MSSAGECHYGNRRNNNIYGFVCCLLASKKIAQKLQKNGIERRERERERET